jgi:hypothetical protein
MAFFTVLRDGENLGEAALQREMTFMLSDCPVVTGVGTGFSAGVVGKMNGAAGANPNHFSVQANGSNLILTIQPGYCWIVKDNGASSYDPRVIYAGMTAATTLTLPSNSQGSTRVDTICLRIDQSIAPDANGTNLPSIVDVQGGASSALGNAPSDGALYLPLALVTIANGATSVSQSNVADARMVQPNQARFAAQMNTAQSITDNTWTQIQYDTVNEDASGMFTTGATAKFTAPLSGWYNVRWCVTFSAAGTSMVAGGSWVQKNGTSSFYKQGSSMSGTVASNADGTSVGSARVHLNRGDTINIAAMQHLTTPASLTLFASTSSIFYNFFEGEFVSFAGTVINQ